MLVNITESQLNKRLWNVHYRTPFSGQHNQALDLYRQADDACAAAMATAPDAERVRQLTDAEAPTTCTANDKVPHHWEHLRWQDALAALRMTIKFNAARLLEDAGKPEEATAAYRAHIAAHPAYVEGAQNSDLRSFRSARSPSPRPPGLFV